MSVTARRVIYAALTAAGFAMMVPMAVQSRMLRAELNRDPAALQSILLEPAWTRLTLLALLGLVLATGFLYAALSVGYRKAWRPQENDRITCSRCGVEVGFGVGRCPSCQQQFVW